MTFGDDDLLTQARATEQRDSQIAQLAFDLFNVSYRMVDALGGDVYAHYRAERARLFDELAAWLGEDR